MQLSWIQREILSSMLRKESTRVKEMIPADMPANLFSYHLDGLIKAGYIERIDRGLYRFTVTGEKLAGTFSSDTKHVTENIKTVIMFYANVKGRRLCFRWSRQPYLGQVTPVYDRMKHGQTLGEALEQALEDKLMRDLQTCYKKDSLIRILHEENLVSHMHAIVYEVSLPDDFSEITSRNGIAFISDTDVVLMDGVQDFLDFVEADDERMGEFVWRY